ncbi:hypothetical protein RND81_09G113500 [Saponaria officinalis]|uniref:Pentatricopeptide repeat-containing protein n=1 Tax=Saponaria officinalis TaxID=3572 RepID=A0AAW1IKP9_SAPOF
MASTLLTPPLSHLSFTSTRPKPNPKPTPTFLTQTRTQIRCGSGPRSNRGPLVKGRILSKEAILAIQSLKRSHKTQSNDSQPLHVSLSRLLKSDLMATLRELLRQDECALALKVFSTIRYETWYSTDFALYADVTIALSRNAMWQDIDRLIEGVDDEVAVKLDDKKGLGRLIRALIAAERRESLVRVYRVMRRFGWGVVGSGVEVDEYLGRVLIKGFVRFGEVELAKELDLVLETYLNSCLGR